MKSGPVLPLIYMAEDRDLQKTGLISHSCIYFGILFLLQCQNNGVIPVLNKMLAVLQVGIQETENNFPSKCQETNFDKHTSQRHSV